MIYDLAENMEVELAVNVTCLECDAEVAVSPDVALWAEITCAACGLVMEVINLDPLELDYALDDEWDEESGWEDEEAWDDVDEEGGAG
jgi:transcription elongation factor Elf1